jgi:hypothetical protein
MRAVGVNWAHRVDNSRAVMAGKHPQASERGLLRRCHQFLQPALLPRGRACGRASTQLQRLETLNAQDKGGCSRPRVCGDARDRCDGRRSSTAQRPTCTPCGAVSAPRAPCVVNTVRDQSNSHSDDWWVRDAKSPESSAPQHIQGMRAHTSD